jgi:D-glycero-beta-D-manno-heptose-7-phosphate kinase
MKNALNSSTWKKTFESFEDFNILVIGDVMIDSYMWGEVSRISPEAPIPIVAAKKRENRLGGAANVALNLQSLGAIPILCSVIGIDAEGKMFLRKMKELGLSCEGIVPDPDRKTTLKTRIICKNQHLLRVDEEQTNPIGKETYRSLVSQLKRILRKRKVDGIIFEDYDKGVISPELIRQVISLAAKKKIPVAADPKRRNFLYYRNIELFKPNFKELTEGLKTDIEKGNAQALFKAVKGYQKEAGIRYLLVSLSELGVFISDGKGYAMLPAEKREIVDVSGAGDTLVSAAFLALLAGLEPGMIARVANLAGGLVCEKIGVVPVGKKELLAKCLQDQKR